MIRSCKNIDITNTATIMPYVVNCIIRHKKRHDFQKLLIQIGGMTEWQYYLGLGSQDYSDWFPAFLRIANEAARRITNHDLQLRPVHIVERVDRSSGKTRQIGDEEAMQQIFDHIAVGAAEEIWGRRIVPQQASSLPFRGPLYGSNLIRQWLKEDNRAARWAHQHKRKYTRKCKYFVKLDVRKCFPSLRTETFMRYFRRDCGNKDLLWLWATLFESHKVNGNEGFMIGSLISQYACQYLLSFAYRYVMDLHKTRRGKRQKLVSHTIFYMDDQALFGSSRRDLKKAVQELIQFEKEKLGLVIKPTWCIQETERHPIDMMGYRHYANEKRTIRSRIFLRARRVACRVIRRGNMALGQARKLCSYKGYFKYTDSRKIADELRLNKQFKLAAYIIGCYDRSGKNGNGILQCGAGSSSVYAPA